MRRIDKNFKKEIEHVRKYQMESIELKNTITKLKDTLEKWRGPIADWRE